MVEEKLSPELIKELNDILKLPEKEQQEKLNSFLKKLSPGQIELLKKNQSSGQQCPFCLISENKIQSYKVYEDNDFVCVLDINPANEGHVLVIPKKHCNSLKEIDEKTISNMFILANNIGNSLYDSIKAEGFNIFLADGVAAGQNVSHVITHVIPRFNGDKVKFFWEHLKFGKEEMEKIVDMIKSKIKKEEKVIKQEFKEIDYSDFDEIIP